MFKWYIIQTQSGFETKVSEVINEKSEGGEFSSFIEEVFVPKQKNITIVRGKKVESEKSLFPGYVLVRLDLNDNVWHFIKSIPKVNGFLGDNNNPSSVSDSDVERIYKRIENLDTDLSSGFDYQIGESVKVTEGPFESFVGIIDSVDSNKNQIKVLVSIFGRETPVVLEYTQVEKV